MLLAGTTPKKRDKTKEKTDFVAKLRKSMGQEPVILHGDTWDMWESEEEMREVIEGVAFDKNYIVVWLRMICEDQPDFQKPTWLRMKNIDFISNEWEACLFSPKHYNWQEIAAFLVTHFQKYVVDATSTILSVVDLKQMILETYPEQGPEDAYIMAENLVDEFAGLEDSITFDELLQCYELSLREEPDSVFGELKIIGFNLDSMTLGDVSEHMLDCLDELTASPPASPAIPTHGLEPLNGEPMDDQQKELLELAEKMEEVLRMEQQLRDQTAALEQQTGI